jgi:hypothetical protein
MHDNQALQQRQDNGRNGFGVGASRYLVGVAPAGGQPYAVVERLGLGLQGHPAPISALARTISSLLRK